MTNPTLPSAETAYYWVELLAALGGGAILTLLRTSILKFFGGIFRYLFRARSVIGENMELRESNAELSSRLRITEASKNDYKSFCAELEGHLNRISADLDSARKELSDFKEVMASQEKLIEVLKKDRDLALNWGRILMGQILKLEASPDAQEPEMVSLAEQRKSERRSKEGNK